MDFHGNINLQQNKMQRMVVQSESNFPETPLVGRVVFKDQKLYMCVAINNTIPVWLPLTNKIDTFVHTEAVAATTWTVTHNLNTTIPLLQVYNAAGEMLIPDSVTPLSNNEMTVTFNTAMAGTAIVLFGELMPASGVGLLEPGIPAWIVDVSNITYNSEFFYIGGQDANSTGVAFNDTGLRMYMVGTSDDVHQYDLSVAYDVTTATYNSELFYVHNQERNPTDVIFNPGGTKMFICGTYALIRFHEYDLLTPFDVTSAVYNNVRLTVSGQDNSPAGIVFNDDGTQLFMVGEQYKHVYQYNLGSPYDFSTISYSGTSFSVASETLIPRGIQFNNTGTQMFIVSDSVYQYTLTVPFDITTAAYDSTSYDLSNEDFDPHGIVFKPDNGDTMWIIGAGSDQVYQYNTNI